MTTLWRVASLSLVVVAGAAAWSAARAGDGDVEAGRQKTQPCQACHGTDGNGKDPQFPRLAGQHADYLVRALADYKSGARQNPIMAGFAGQLTEQDRRDIAAFYASQVGLNTLSFED